MTKKAEICTACDGWGHDAASKPEFRFEILRLPNGRVKKKYITVKQGSGCIQCGGTGVLSDD